MPLAAGTEAQRRSVLQTAGKRHAEVEGAKTLRGRATEPGEELTMTAKGHGVVPRLRERPKKVAVGIRREGFDLIVRIDAIGGIHEDQRPGEIARVEAKVAACGRSGACHAVQRQRDAPERIIDVKAHERSLEDARIKHRPRAEIRCADHIRLRQHPDRLPHRPQL